MIGVYIAAGVVGLLLIAFAVSYDRFVRQRNLIKNSWANVDTELRRRYDLIPNLVEAVKGYAAHEKEIFEKLAQARADAIAQAGPPEAQARAENGVVSGLRQLLAVAENYPQLKASQNFLSLQNELTNTEDRIQAARRFYNNNVRAYNTRVQSFPSNAIAGMFHFQEQQYFEIDEAVARAGAPQVDLAPDTGTP
ncbi:MAG: LemA family protein [Actinobacteria bacterium]|nr:MAG: LemA family protein [Actinomycetota bacterium]